MHTVMEIHRYKPIPKINLLLEEIIEIIILSQNNERASCSYYISETLFRNLCVFEVNYLLFLLQVRKLGN